MFLLEADEVVIPVETPSKNTTTENVKKLLDRLAGLSTLGLVPDSPSGYDSRVSFRDLVSFVFQPQYIVANPLVLFYNADSSEHREKLKSIFPYALGALTPQMVSTRWEIDRVQRELRRAESALTSEQKAVEEWRVEARGWLRQSIELGILPTSTELPDDWSRSVDLLREAARAETRSLVLTGDAIEGTLKQLEHLADRESVAAAELSEARHRLHEIQRLLQSSESYGDAIRIQRDRLDISKWLRQRAEQAREVDSMLREGALDRLDELVEAVSGLEIQLRSQPSLSDTLERERVRLRARVEEATGTLMAIRQETALLEQASGQARRALYRQDQIERFVGRIEQALEVLDRSDFGSALSGRVAALRDELSSLRQGYSEVQVKIRTQRAVEIVQSIAARIIPSLDAEWPLLPINLLIDDLTIKVVRPDRSDYLWEIGSGANWLAYHVSVTLALHRFFLEGAYHPVPSFIVYDQPSQVYFPRGFEVETTPEPGRTRDQDVKAVRSVFEAFGAEVALAKGRLQIIVLDHAGPSVWGDILGVTASAEWRDGEKLVPESWLVGTSQ